VTALCTVNVLQNVALNKPASQISTYSTHVASLAVDGRYDSPACTHDHMHPWWGVDLGAAYYVAHVIVTHDVDTVQR